MEETCMEEEEYPGFMDDKCKGKWIATLENVVNDLNGQCQHTSKKYNISNMLRF